MLGLLDRVPQQQLADLVVAEHRAGLGAGEQRLGERGGVVLERGGDRQLVAGRQHLVEDGEQALRQTVHAAGGVAQLRQPPVELPVLAAVDGLLADEAGDLPSQLRIGDLVAVVADAAHEEVLALGEQRGQDGHGVAHHEVAGHEVRIVPVARPVRVAERDAPHGDRSGWGGRALHRTLLPRDVVQRRSVRAAVLVRPIARRRRRPTRRFLQKMLERRWSKPRTPGPGEVLDRVVSYVTFVRLPPTISTMGAVQSSGRAIHAGRTAHHDTPASLGGRNPSSFAMSRAMAMPEVWKMNSGME